MNARHTRLRRWISGVTLVELMIAMTLGLILSVVLANVFVSNARTRLEMDNSGRQIENGRYAMQVLIDDLSNAGFFAGADLVGALDQGDFCVASNGNILSPFLDVITSAKTCTPNLKAGTQAIALRRLSTSAAATATAISCPAEFTCVQVGSDGAPRFKTGAQGEKLTTGEYAPVRVPVTHVYYVDGNDTLRRVALTWAAGVPSMPSTIEGTEAIADGVERLAFTMIPNSTDPTSVRVELLVRSPEQTPGFKDSKTYLFGVDGYTPADNYRRQYYSATVPLYNPISAP